jgi:hypothetical protein
MLLFFSISFAIWLEKFTQKLYLGFLVVAVIYAFFGFVIILFIIGVAIFDKDKH